MSLFRPRFINAEKSAFSPDFSTEICYRGHLTEKYLDGDNNKLFITFLTAITQLSPEKSRNLEVWCVIVVKFLQKFNGQNAGLISQEK